MPTFAWPARFRDDFEHLTPAQQAAFLAAVTQFVADVRSGLLRKGLRVKGIQGAAGLFEMTWAADGRATFEYGKSVRGNEVHVTWRRVGTHSVFKSP